LTAPPPPPAAAPSAVGARGVFGDDDDDDDGDEDDKDVGAWGAPEKLLLGAVWSLAPLGGGSGARSAGGGWATDWCIGLAGGADEGTDGAADDGGGAADDRAACAAGMNDEVG
jgi:hypothetical protein